MSEYERPSAVAGVAEVTPDGPAGASLSRGSCRLCGQALRRTFVDLGMSPLCESFLQADQIDQMEPFYPLHAFVCESCFLVQLQEYVPPEEIFSEYAYFSSFSSAWLDHAREYVATMSERLGLGSGSMVVELASNDGYLLQYFVKRGVPVLGIEPAANVAEAARERGVRTLVEFFGEDLGARLAAEGVSADLVIGNNVLAQVPDLHSFVGGIKRILGPAGRVTLEFPHLLRLMQENQFDTIYHEHFSYFSVMTVERVLGDHGLAAVDVEELWTHGGSLRVHAVHMEAGIEPSERLRELHRREQQAGLARIETYAAFDEQVKETKRRLLRFLIDAKAAGKQIVGYGAPGKGNTLLNYCGIRTDFLDYTVDRNPYKHGRFLPGTRIPIYDPSRIAETRPDYILILPWNLKDEIVSSMAHVREWGGTFVVPIPEVEVLP